MMGPWLLSGVSVRWKMADIKNALMAFGKKSGYG